MNKFFLNTLGIAAVCSSFCACSSGDKGQGNDTVFSAEFADSFTVAVSNDMGATLAQTIKITEEMEGVPYNRKDYLKGLQLIVGSEHSIEFLEGVDQGCKIAMYLKMLKEDGLELNRDELLRNIRRLVMADSVSAKDADFYKTESERFNKAFNEVLAKREAARAGAAPTVVIANTEIDEEFDSEEISPEELAELQAMMNQAVPDSVSE